MTASKTICKPVTTCKTVSKKCGECVVEQYCVPGKVKHHWVKECGECCFDPCTCQTTHKSGKWTRVCEKCPDEMRCRKVWKEHTVCESVPCTTYVKECVHEKVPYTVCKKVPHTEIKKVPYCVTRNVQETIVKKVPYTMTRMESQVIKKSVPYTVVRHVKGAYMDSTGCGHANESECGGAGCERRAGCERASALARAATTSSKAPLPAHVDDHEHAHGFRDAHQESALYGVEERARGMCQDGAVHRLPYGAAHRQEDGAVHDLRDGDGNLSQESAVYRVPHGAVHDLQDGAVHRVQAGAVYDLLEGAVHGDGMRADDGVQEGARLRDGRCVREALAPGRLRSCSGCSGCSGLRRCLWFGLVLRLRLRHRLHNQLPSGKLVEQTVLPPPGLQLLRQWLHQQLRRLHQQLWRLR